MKKEERIKLCRFMYSAVCIILGSESLMLFMTSLKIKGIAGELPNLQPAVSVLQSVSFLLAFGLLILITVRVAYPTQKEE